MDGQARWGRAWISSADHLGLEEADDRLCEGVIVGVADGADGALDAGLGEPVGVADREVLQCPSQSSAARDPRVECRLLEPRGNSDHPYAFRDASKRGQGGDGHAK